MVIQLVASCLSTMVSNLYHDSTGKVVNCLFELLGNEDDTVLNLGR